MNFQEYKESPQRSKIFIWLLKNNFKKISEQKIFIFYKVSTCLVFLFESQKVDTYILKKNKPVTYNLCRSSIASIINRNSEFLT